MFQGYILVYYLVLEFYSIVYVYLQQQYVTFSFGEHIVATAEIK